VLKTERFCEKATEAEEALRFYAELQERMSVAACSELFRGAVARFGIEVFACGEIDLDDRDRNVMFMAEWPKAWVRFYVKSGLIKSDPLLNAVTLYRKPFTFGDIIHDKRFSTLERDALRAAAEQGWTQGLAVPVARGGSRFGLVTLLGRGEQLDSSLRVYLCLISECLLTRVRSLAQGREAGYAMPPAALSKREVEAARLVALGCSDAEIAAEFGISESTAHKHVEGGRKRLKAKNRAHMAALSVSLCIATAT
jgi:DNA-binding CsgD family transcriptional regulator